MNRKGKGTRAERELFHMFYNTNKFLPLRVAGSGSTPIPAPDLLVGNGSRILAIECKAIKGTKKYLEQHSLVESNVLSFNDFIKNRMISYLNPIVFYREFFNRIRSFEDINYVIRMFLALVGKEYSPIYKK